jgi:hypothetical protein
MMDILNRLLATIYWLNAVPGRKRGLTLVLAAFGQLLRQSSRLSGAAPWVDQVVLFIQGDMVPAVDALTWVMGAVALWHPASKAAAKAAGIPPPTETPVVAVPESFQVAQPAQPAKPRPHITQGPGFKG